MNASSISQSVLEMIEPIVQEEKLELVDVEYKKSGRDWVLRIYIDKETGITHDDCQRVSRQVEDRIEVEGLISGHFVLEVSSPGLDRPLKKEKDFLRYRNKRVRVKTFAPIGKQRNFSGTIEAFENGVLFLRDESRTIEIAHDNIAQARLIIDF